MGWVVALALVVVGLVNRDPMTLVAAGIFALTGAVSAVAVSIGKTVEGEKE